MGAGYHGQVIDGHCRVGTGFTLGLHLGDLKSIGADIAQAQRGWWAALGGGQAEHIGYGAESIGKSHRSEVQVAAAVL